MLSSVAGIGFQFGTYTADVEDESVEVCLELFDVQVPLGSGVWVNISSEDQTAIGKLKKLYANLYTLSHLTFISQTCGYFVLYFAE